MVGINDFNKDIPLGALDRTTAPKYDSSNFSKSYEAMLMDIIGRKYTKAKIYCLNIAFTASAYAFLKQNGAGNKLYEYRQAIEDAATEYEANTIHLNRLCITSANIGSLAIDKLHPGPEYMTMIANQCYTEMMASNCL